MVLLLLCVRFQINNQIMRYGTIFLFYALLLLSACHKKPARTQPVVTVETPQEQSTETSSEGNVYQAGTLSGNPVAMSAGIAQLTELLKMGFYKDLNSKAKEFSDAITRFAATNNYPFKVFNIGSIFWFAFTEREHIRTASEINSQSMDKFKVLHKELLNRGVYLGPSGYEVGFVSAAHSKVDLEKAKRAVFESLDVVFRH